MRYFVSAPYWMHTGRWGRKFVVSDVVPKGNFFEVDEQSFKHYKRECRLARHTQELAMPANMDESFWKAVFQEFGLRCKPISKTLGRQAW
jgi:hypothetical protein